MYFSLLPVPLTESLLEETLALKTTGTAREQKPDRVTCRMRLMLCTLSPTASAFNYCLLANMFSCNRTEVGVEGWLEEAVMQLFTH